MANPKPARLRLVTDEAATSYLSEDAEASARAALSGGTRRRYAAAWAAFTAWCQVEDRTTLPASPETASSYLASLRVRGLAASSLRIALAAINRYHIDAGHPAPGQSDRVKTALAGDHRLIRRARRVRRKAGLLPGDLRAIVSRLDLDSAKGLRDRALLLVGYAAALRRSELVGLTVEDVEFDGTCNDGMRVHIRDAKTAVDDETQFVDVKTARDPDLCPVGALHEWLDAARIEDGPIFRRIRKGGRVLPTALTGRSLGRIVKGLAREAGLAGDYGGHSLRAGFVTSALERDLPVPSIQRVTRHASASMIATYDRRRVVYVDAGL